MKDIVFPCVVIAVAFALIFLFSIAVSLQEFSTKYQPCAAVAK